MGTYVIVERDPNRDVMGVIGPWRSREAADTVADQLFAAAPAWRYTVERIRSVADHAERAASRRR